MYEVTYIINESGIRVTKTFDSYYKAEQTVRKLKHSSLCTFVSIMKVF